MDTQNNSIIVALPIEIIESVIQYLRLSELCDFRLTCKALAEKSSYYFAHTYCTEARTNFSLASIQRLEHRSRSSWATYVTEFRLVWDKEAGEGLHWDREYNFGPLLTSLPVIQQMRDILLRFDNCYTFCIGNVRDDNVSQITLSYRIQNSDIVALGFMLVAESALPLKKFCLQNLEGLDEYYERHEWCPRYGLDEKNLHLEQTRRTGFITAFSTLKELRLWPSTEVEHGRQGPVPPRPWKWDLVAQTSCLEELDLEVGVHRPLYLRPLSLPFLRTLHFRSAHVTSANLLELLLGVRGTLRSLTLWLVTVDRGYREIFSHLQHFDRLEYINVHGLRAFGPTKGFCAFHEFERTNEELGLETQPLWLLRGSNDIVAVRYSGPDTQKVIAILLQGLEENR